MRSKTLIILVFVFLTVSIISCEKKPEATNGTITTTNPTVNVNPTPVNTTPPIEKEAYEKGKEVFDQFYTKCGENYVIGFYSFVNDIYHYKNVTFSLRKGPETEADKLNGIEFNGTFLAAAKFKRKSTSFQGRVEYKDWQPAGDSFASIRMTKRKGQDWAISSGFLNYHKIKCSDIPSGIPE